MKAHENILVFYRAAPFYSAEKSTGHKRQKSGPKRAPTGIIYGKTRSGDPRTAYDSTERYPRSVVTFSSEKQRGAVHPTQKPVDLLRYLIRLYSRPGETVLDNCMGCGSTGVAAVAERRNFVGIELAPGYFDVAFDRIEAALMSISDSVNP